MLPHIAPPSNDLLVLATMVEAFLADEEGTVNEPTKGWVVRLGAIDKHARPALSPLWEQLTADLDDFPKPMPTKAEAWKAAQPILKRVKVWGWKVLNADMKEVREMAEVLG